MVENRRLWRCGVVFAAQAEAQNYAKDFGVMIDGPPADSRYFQRRSLFLIITANARSGWQGYRLVCMKSLAHQM